MSDALLRFANLRDIGGVCTESGRLVQRGKVFRSAALTDLTGETLAAVRAIGIRTIVDLRRNTEREACPTPWQEIGCVTYWSRDHDLSEADHLSRMRHPDLTADDSRAAMTALYTHLPYDQVEAYRRLFRAIVEGAVPVLFHCAVGKDRTGVAAALILAALGVAREDILADYVATGAFHLAASPHARGWPAKSPERAAAIAPLLRTDTAYLDAMFDAVERRSGSVAGYLSETLGVDEAALRRLLLE